MTMLNPWSSMAQQPSPSEVVTEEITINADSASTNSVATYKGGYNALLTALAKNIQYPAECAEANIQGKVVLRIGVDENGKSADITVLRSVHTALDAEAKRLKKELAKAEKDLASVERTLGNAGFVAKAAPEVIEKKQSQKAELTATVEQLKAQIADFE